jgi:beta-glucosidase-like glycosyl hydrolase
MVAAYSNRDLKHVKEIKDLIVNYNIGGLIWMQGGPLRQGQLANYYQSIAKTPLLYSIDGEWGLAMRLDSTVRYPKQMTLGAIQNDSLIYRMGRQIARECSRIGIHINFAPVVDINSNPLNPVIGMRSFGENKQKVAQKAYMYMAGMQNEHVLANAKHFPGHGDTDSDSHKTLPVVAHSITRLDSLELFPFQYLFDRGLGSIMVAHLNIPSLDTTRNLAATLSPKIVTELLKNKMNFKGLVFTDALNMKGVSRFFEPGIVDVKAILAGNDVLLFSEDVAKAITQINKAISEGKIKRETIDERCKKILKAKFWCGLNTRAQITTRNLYQDLNSKVSEALNDELAQAAITLLKNDERFLPLKKLDNLKIVEVSFGTEEKNALCSTLNEFSFVEHVAITHDAPSSKIAELFEKIKQADIVIAQLNKTTLKADNNYGVSDQSLYLMDSVARLKPSLLVVFGNPYLLNKISSVANFKSVILAYEYTPSLLKAAANAILGLNKINGQLPVTTKYFPYASGISLEARSKEEIFLARENFKQKRFAAIDSIAISGITEKAYPGCEIVAMQNGQVIYQKSFGSYTYDHKSKPVDNATIYDLASVTKIAASSLALMKLESEGKFDYTKTLGFYLPQLKGSNKENLKIEDVLTHQAGLPAWIPFYLKTLNKKHKFKSGYYSHKASEDFPTQVAKNLFVVKGFRDTIYQKIINAPMETQGKYLYSDIGYYFMQQIVEQITNKNLNDYVKDIYAQLGLALSYKPLNYFSINQIAPSENDKIFRKQLVQGYVHDPGAAL